MDPGLDGRRSSQVRLSHQQQAWRFSAGHLPASWGRGRQTQHQAQNTFPGTFKNGNVPPGVSTQYHEGQGTLLEQDPWLQLELWLDFPCSRANACSKRSGEQHGVAWRQRGSRHSACVCNKYKHHIITPLYSALTLGTHFPSHYRTYWGFVIQIRAKDTKIPEQILIGTSCFCRELLAHHKPVGTKPEQGCR